MDLFTLWNAGVFVVYRAVHVGVHRTCTSHDYTWVDGA